MLNSSVSFVADKQILNVIDTLINEESLIDDMVVTFDYVNSERTDMIVYACETDEHNWVDIFKIEERILEKHPHAQFEVIYASTDSETYIDVISTNGNFDVYVNDDSERIEELCNSYSLEFFADSESEEEMSWDEEDEYNENY